MGGIGQFRQELDQLENHLPQGRYGVEGENTDQGGQDQFGAHGAFEKEGKKGGGVPHLSIKELNGYFDSLDNSTTTEKETLTELVKSNETLTTSNATLTATIAGLQNQLGTIGRGKKPRKDPAKPKRTCPNCK